MTGQIVVVGLDWGWRTVVDPAVGVADESVVVGLLNPFVNNASRPGANHIWAENSSLIIECSLPTHVAASLRKEDGNVVAFGHGLEVAVSGRIVCRSTAPFIRVEAEEVDNLVGFGTASEVILQHRSQFGDISCRVPDWDLAVLLLGHVRLHVCRSSLDVGCSEGASSRVDDLIPDPESCQIVVLLEDVHDFGEGEE